MAFTVDGSNGLTFPDSTNMASATALGMRNRIINGAMQIDQRRSGASASSATGSGYTYTCDRFRVYNGLVSGVITVQQSTTAPAGFVNSSYMTTTTAQSSLGSGELMSFEQGIEGNNIADLGWGTASAKTVTLSFWVRASVTGNYDVAIRNNFSVTNRSYVTTFNVASSNTWEYKTITIAGDTSGTWSTDNLAGIYVIWNLASGSSYITGSINTWQTGNYFATSGGTRLLSTNAATLYITGVQIEIGTQATPFEWRPYGVQLTLCQRYYEKSYNIPTVPGTVVQGQLNFTENGFSVRRGTLEFKVPKRTAPTMTFYNHNTGAAGTWYFNPGAASYAVISGTTTENSFEPNQATGSFPAFSYTYGQWVASAEL